MLLVLVGGAASAQTVDAGTADKVTTTWKLLDYMAVDYDGAVRNGQIVSRGEYAEMTEFADTIVSTIGDLPSRPGRSALVQQAGALQRQVDAKEGGDRIAATAHALSKALLTAYPVAIAPKTPPDVSRGDRLFADNCAACHGASGNGKGPNAAALDTPPIAFTDAGRARKRSLAALEQVITQGIDGTAMQSFRDLPPADRWALAFRAGEFAFSEADVQRGKALWRNEAAIRSRIPDLKTLVTTTSAALGEAIGKQKADAVMAYLRMHPEAVARASTGGAGDSIAVTRTKLDASLAAYRAGDAKKAKALALSAYLDGFEPIEPLLSAKDAGLMANIETRMGAFRAGIGDGISSGELASRAAAIETLLDDASAALSPQASSAVSTFLGAFTILLREGLEALLIVVAMLAFLRKAERVDALRYVHGGWISALAAGGATWAVATYAIGISGASRELTEGLGSLLAAVVLLSVGIWMHGKSHADQWQRYIRKKLSGALNRQSGWFLFALAFVVVYREVFETILFYAALWAQGNGAVMLLGAGAAIGVLALIAWAMLRYSRSLPIGTFFRYSAWLMAILTVVLAGKGVAALQEAGWIDIAPLAEMPRISILGVFPTWQSVLAQIVALVAIVIGFVLNDRQKRPQTAT
ncbi:MAG: cytochrome c/FTR1 family iron permease [Sphingomonadaceae bacterium]